MYNNLRNSMTKNRFSQHVQKTEHINWVWFGILHAAQRKLFPKFNFFHKNPQKVIEDEHFLLKSQRFASSVSFNVTERV